MIKLKRLFYNEKFTCGHLSFGGFNCFCLEDTFHDTKIKGETRIPAGTYELKIRKELTPLTIKHREAYKNSPWFKANPDWYHIEITGIKDYSGVYIHSGNDQSHTLGCLLPAMTFDLVQGKTSNSLIATDKIYSMVYPRLFKGERIFITIKDEKE